MWQRIHKYDQIIRQRQTPLTLGEFSKIHFAFRFQMSNKSRIMLKPEPTSALLCVCCR